MDADMARRITAFVTVAAPVSIIAFDVLMLAFFGSQTTITSVVRGWSVKSIWPEVVFILGAVGLYVHFFRNWL